MSCVAYSMYGVTYSTYNIAYSMYGVTYSTYNIAYSMYGVAYLMYCVAYSRQKGPRYGFLVVCVLTFF